VPSALTNVIRPGALLMYDRLFVSNLALKFAIYCLNQCKRFAGEAASMASTTGRQFTLCVQLLHFFLSNVAFSWQVDVQDTHFRALLDALAGAASVDDAARAHAVFIEDLTAGAFLGEEGRDVARGIGELVMLAFSVFGLAREDSTRRALDAIAAAESAAMSSTTTAAAAASRPGVAAPPQLAPRATELRNTMPRVAASIVRRVTTVMRPIAASRRAEHRALWTRLDFNGWFSRQAAALAEMSASTSSINRSSSSVA
jgi:hypothetical protein